MRILRILRAPDAARCSQALPRLKRHGAHESYCVGYTDMVTNGRGHDSMGLGRALLCILLPPLAVLDKGCGSILLVTLLTLAGWVPGVLAALFICNKD